MEFLQFARAHGLLIKDLKIGRWCRVPTEDHPRKRNGAYKLMGDHGFVQNWAVHEEPELWKPESTQEIRIDHARIAAIAQREKERIRTGQQLSSHGPRLLWRELKANAHEVTQHAQIHKAR
jgi:putative DNA primase/helicase